MKFSNYLILFLIFVSSLTFFSCGKSQIEKANRLEKQLEQWRVRLKMPAELRKIV